MQTIQAYGDFATLSVTNVLIFYNDDITIQCKKVLFYCFLIRNAVKIVKLQIMENKMKNIILLVFPPLQLMEFYLLYIFYSLTNEPKLNQATKHVTVNFNLPVVYGKPKVFFPFYCHNSSTLCGDTL